MVMIIDILTWLLLLFGGFFCVVGGIGLIRLPDFYTRTHAGGLTDTLGAGLILLALMLQTFVLESGWHWMAFVKLLGILVFLFFTSPTSGHALARAAFSHGLKPQLSGEPFDERLMDGETRPAMGRALSTVGDSGTADDDDGANDLGEPDTGGEREGGAASS